MPVQGIDQLIKNAQQQHASSQATAQPRSGGAATTPPASVSEGALGNVGQPRPAPPDVKIGGNMIGAVQGQQPAANPFNVGQPLMAGVPPTESAPQLQNPFLAQPGNPQAGYLPPGARPDVSAGYTNPFQRPDAKADKPNVQPTQPTPEQATTTRGANDVGFKRQDVISRLTAPVEQGEPFMPQEFSTVSEQFATDMFGDRERMLRFFTRFRDYFQPRGLPTDKQKKDKK